VGVEVFVAVAVGVEVRTIWGTEVTDGLFVGLTARQECNAKPTEVSVRTEKSNTVILPAALRQEAV